MENEDEEDDIFTTKKTGYEEQENVKEPEDEEESEEEEKDTERKSSLNIPVPSRSLTSRRASLPCPAQLNAMQLSRLHAASPAYPCRQLESDEARPCSRSSHQGNNEEEREQVTSSTSDRRTPAIPTIPEVHGPPERKARFRSRNVMSMSDADTVCLICHDDLRKGGRAVRELHCSHSFHSECIEEWLWSKQACPTCRKHVVMPEPLYWTSTRLIVP